MKVTKSINRCMVLILFLILPALAPLPAVAGEPTEQIRQTVDDVLEVLNNRELKKPAARETRRKKIHDIVNKRFDFEEMAKRSLAVHWAGRTPEERTEFVTLYSELLENTYIRKVERYDNEKVSYVGEKVDGQYATVKTVVSTKEVDIPVDYKIFREAGKWGVYDIVIEGVSLVNNYRTQFNQIIRSSSYEDLVKRLREKNLKGS